MSNTIDSFGLKEFLGNDRANQFRRRREQRAAREQRRQRRQHQRRQHQHQPRQHKPSHHQRRRRNNRRQNNRVVSGVTRRHDREMKVYIHAWEPVNFNGSLMEEDPYTEYERIFNAYGTFVHTAAAIYDRQLLVPAVRQRRRGLYDVDLYGELECAAQILVRIAIWIRETFENVERDPFEFVDEFDPFLQYRTWLRKTLEFDLDPFELDPFFGYECPLDSYPSFRRWVTHSRSWMMRARYNFSWTDPYWNFEIEDQFDLMGAMPEEEEEEQEPNPNLPWSMPIPTTVDVRDFARTRPDAAGDFARKRLFDRRWPIVKLLRLIGDGRAKPKHELFFQLGIVGWNGNVSPQTKLLRTGPWYQGSVGEAIWRSVVSFLGYTDDDEGFWYDLDQLQHPEEWRFGPGWSQRTV